MNTNESLGRTGWAVRIVVLLLLLLPLAAALDAGSARAGAGDEVEFEGVVLQSPASVDGSGTWQIRAEDDGGQRIWRVRSDGATEFENGIPIVGDHVEVKAQRGASDELLALRMRRDDRGDDGGAGGEDKYAGRVLTRPTGADGLGEWQLQTERNTTLLVIATATTRFDLPLPVVGDWVEVRGTLRTDGAILATRIKIDDYEGGEVVVRLEPGVTPEDFAARHQLSIVSAVLASGDIYLFRLDDDDLEVRTVVQPLLQDPDVIWAELNFAGGAPVGDPYRTWGWGGTEPTEYENQAAFDQVNLAAAVGVATGRNVIIAVLDTGVDLDHPELTGHLLAGRDLIDDDLLPDEAPGGLAWGHGTHTAGIITHIAPESKLLPVRVLDRNGRGNTFLLAYAIEWALEQGADVINLSLGTPFDSAVLRSAVADAVEHGAVIVAAAGNDSTDMPQYPAAYPGVITVTAVDGAGVKADFANYGAAWVDLSAPGVGIVSTIVGPDGSGYATWSGTSMAAPFASGAAALVAQVDAAAGAEALIQSAASLDAVNPTHAGAIGGLLDIGAALGQDGANPDQRIFMPLIVR